MTLDKDSIVWIGGIPYFRGVSRSSICERAERWASEGITASEVNLRRLLCTGNDAENLLRVRGLLTIKRVAYEAGDQAGFDRAVVWLRSQVARPMGVEHDDPAAIADWLETENKKENGE